MTITSLAVFSIGQAEATTLTSSVNVDNEFIEYLSPNANSLVGATIVQEQITWPYSVYPGWGTTVTNNSATISGQSEYLIIQAINTGGPGAFLGDFSLSDTGYQFANGTQSISTGNPNWGVSTTGTLGAYYGTTTGSLGTFVQATIEAQNGSGIWGSYMGQIPGIKASSSWISDSSDGYYNGGSNTSYFETVINCTSNSSCTTYIPPSTGGSMGSVPIATTPVPAAIWMVGSALAGLIGFGCRKLLV